jgi:transcriptional regulator with XRE-family HTH domain
VESHVLAALSDLYRGIPKDKRPSQHALARAEGAPDQSTISKALAGEKTLTLDQLYALCRELGVRASTLVANAERAVAADKVVPLRPARRVSTPVKRAARTAKRDPGDS